MFKYAVCKLVYAICSALNARWRPSCRLAVSMTGTPYSVCELCRAVISDIHILARPHACTHTEVIFKLYVRACVRVMRDLERLSALRRRSVALPLSLSLTLSFSIICVVTTSVINVNIACPSVRPSVPSRARLDLPHGAVLMCRVGRCFVHRHQPGHPFCRRRYR